MVLAVSFSPDGKSIATGSRDDTVKLWSVPDGKCLVSLTGHGNGIYSTSFSPDGKYLATGSGDKSVKLWSIPDGKLITTLAGHKDCVRGVSFSPDGKCLATGSDDKSAKLWSISEGKCIATFEGHSDRVHCISYSPDGKCLATGSGDKTAKLWSISEGKCIATFEGHGNSVYGVSYSPDGKCLATAGLDRVAKLWSISEGKCFATLTGHGTTVFSVSFSPDGKWLGTASADKTAGLWAVDKWTASKPRYSARPRLHLTQSRDGITYPGELVWLQIGVENIGQGELAQLWAELKSDNPALGGLTAAFGRVDAGTRLDRCIAVVLPTDTKAGELVAELVFHEANGCAPPVQEITFDVRPLPRPDFPLSFHLEAEIPGKPPERRTVCKRKEIIDIVVAVTNRTGDDLPELELVLTAVKVPNGVRITGDRYSLGVLNDDTTAEGRLSFTVDANAQLGPATFEFRVVSNDDRTFAIVPVETVIQ